MDIQTKVQPKVQPKDQTKKELNTKGSPENVFLFIPNIIGYFRILFALISIYYMQTNYIKASVFYFLSSFLDAFDGYAARYLNQATKFGAILDQLTDRAALLALVINLCVFYPEHLFCLQLSAIIDIASHWMYIWVGLLEGKSSHKLIDPSQSRILSIYYTSRPVLFVMCFANELFYASLYVMYFTNGPLSKCILRLIIIFFAIHNTNIYFSFSFSSTYIKYWSC